MDNSHIQQLAEKLWFEVEQILEYYDRVACSCAFPRFRQYVSIDCSDTGNSFYVSETEIFISRCEKYFDIQKLESEGSGEVASAIYTCKKCASTYDFGWSDFSIRVNRSFLKIKDKKTEDIGAEIQTPIPVLIGPIGHSLPADTFVKCELDAFAIYLRERK